MPEPTVVKQPGTPAAAPTPAKAVEPGAAPSPVKVTELSTGQTIISTEPVQEPENKVPLTRLNEEIEKRKVLQTKIDELEAAKPPASAASAPKPIVPGSPTQLDEDGERYVDGVSLSFGVDEYDNRKVPPETVKAIMFLNAQSNANSNIDIKVKNNVDSYIDENPKAKAFRKEIIDAINQIPNKASRAHPQAVLDTYYKVLGKKLEDGSLAKDIKENKLDIDLKILNRTIVPNSSGSVSPQGGEGGDEVELSPAQKEEARKNGMSEKDYADGLKKSHTRHK